MTARHWQLFPKLSYKVRSPDLKPLYERARSAIAQLESFTIQHVRREQNSEADRLANLALDDAKLKTKV